MLLDALERLFSRLSNDHFHHAFSHADADTHRYDMDRANIGMDRKYIGKKGFYTASQNDVRILKSFSKASQKFPKNTIVPV